MQFDNQTKKAPTMKINIALLAPLDAINILKTLTDNGFEALLVGGCVRDCILGRQVNDWDITTSATPEEVKNLFDHTVDTGIQHGTVTVVMNKENYEVTTFRIDGQYNNNRSPENVTYSKTFFEDASRRDFTINAFGCDKDGNIFDYFDGLKDLENKTIRAIGDANIRFREDALRMMRCIRFSAQFNFDIESKTFEAIKVNNQLIKNISIERIRIEIDKILTSDNPLNIQLLRDTNLLSHFLPELEQCFLTTQNNKYHCYDVGIHTLKAVECINNSLIHRLCAFFHDIAKPNCKIINSKNEEYFPNHAYHSAILAYKIMRRFKYDNQTIKMVTKIIEYHTLALPLENNLEEEQFFIRKCLRSIDIDTLFILLDLRIADRKAQAFKCTQNELQQIKRLKDYAKYVIDTNICISISQLAVDGNYLKKKGLNGSQIGLTLNRLLDIVIKDPSLNTIQHLDKYIGSIINVGV